MSIVSSAQADSEVILTVAKMIIALPLSASAKNIFFDRP